MATAEDAGHGQHAGPFASREVRPRLTQGQLRSAGYERVARGVYRPAGGAPLDHGGRIVVAQKALVRPVLLGGLSAAWALGAQLADRGDPVVLVVVPPLPDPRPRDGVVVRRVRLRRDEVVRTSLGWVTCPTRTAVDLLLELPRVRAVATVDALLRVTRTPVEDVIAALDGRRGARGVAAARERVARLDPAAESPKESELRLVLFDEGLPLPVLQQAVYDDDGVFVARLDLAWPCLKVALEYDGPTTASEGSTAATWRGTTGCACWAGRFSRWTPTPWPARRRSWLSYARCSAETSLSSATTWSSR